MVNAIETWCYGIKFRSRLEARWAVFLTHARIPWYYETQGYYIDRPAEGTQTPYLPDFYLSDCGTWLEVKGPEDSLDRSLMFDAATDEQLPRQYEGEGGPTFLVVGSIPELTYAYNGYYWDLGWPHPVRVHPTLPLADPWPEDWVRYSVGVTSYYGFGSYHKNKRLWWLDNANNDAYRDIEDEFGKYVTPAHNWLTPVVDSSEVMDTVIAEAYKAARSARFEHGESGAISRDGLIDDPKQRRIEMLKNRLGW